MTTMPDVVPSVVRADHVPVPPQGAWTYDDYAAIPDDGKRYEIVNGVLYFIPTPWTAHQTAVSNLAAYLTLEVRLPGHATVLVRPLDVELAPNVVVQPDVIVILPRHRSIITSSRIIGVPDLLIEVVSPSTAGHDYRAKWDAYARAGVPEYWLADAYAHTVEVLVLADGAYRSLGVFEGTAILPSRIVPEFVVSVEQFFKD